MVESLCTCVESCVPLMAVVSSTACVLYSHVLLHHPTSRGEQESVSEWVSDLPLRVCLYTACVSVITSEWTCSRVKCTLTLLNAILSYCYMLHLSTLFLLYSTTAYSQLALRISSSSWLHFSDTSEQHCLLHDYMYSTTTVTLPEDGDWHSYLYMQISSMRVIEKSTWTSVTALVYSFFVQMCGTM